MTSIDIDIYGNSREVEMMLDYLQGKLSPAGLGEFMLTRVRPYLKNKAQNRFFNEGDDAVGQWLPLKASTQLIRVSQGYGQAHPINRRSGELYRFVTENSGMVTSNGATTVFRTPGKQPTGELKKKFTTAQIGDRETHTLPRPVLGLNEEDLIQTVIMLANYIGGVTPNDD